MDKEEEMTKEELREFWKLGASLQRVPEETNDPQVLSARMRYDYLLAKVLAATKDQARAAEEFKAKLTPKKALEAVDGAIVLFATIAQKMVPQLGEDPTVRDILANGTIASEWLHENISSLGNPEEK